MEEKIIFKSERRNYYGKQRSNDEQQRGNYGDSS